MNFDFNNLLYNVMVLTIRLTDSLDTNHRDNCIIGKLGLEAEPWPLHLPPCTRGWSGHNRGIVAKPTDTSALEQGRGLALPSTAHSAPPMIFGKIIFLGKLGTRH